MAGTPRGRVWLTVRWWMKCFGVGRCVVNGSHALKRLLDIVVAAVRADGALADAAGGDG